MIRSSRLVISEKNREREKTHHNDIEENKMVKEYKCFKSQGHVNKLTYRTL